MKGEDIIGTGETFTSPTIDYIKSGVYNGVIVKFQLEPETLEQLMKKAVINDDSPYIKEIFGNNFPKSVSETNKWTTRNYVLFKTEKIKGTNLQQVNIGLGNGDALKEFNKRIMNFEIINKITKEDWDIFFSNYKLYRDDLLDIFPFKANFSEMKKLLEDAKSDKEFNSQFSEILWRFPNSLTKEEMTKLMQFFLLKDYHHDHENIIGELQSEYNSDVQSVQVLLKRLTNLPKFYRYDEDLKYPFIRKIIYAIGAQPEPYNMKGLEELSISEDEQIRDLALHQIEKRKKEKGGR